MSDFAPYVPEKFNPRGWLPHRNVLLAVLCLALAALALGVFGTLPMFRLPACVVVMASVFAFAQFTYSAAARPEPMDETLAVRLYERMEWQWVRFSQPLAVAAHTKQHTRQHAQGERVRA